MTWLTSPAHYEFVQLKSEYRQCINCRMIANIGTHRMNRIFYINESINQFFIGTEAFYKGMCC